MKMAPSGGSLSFPHPPHNHLTTQPTNQLARILMLLPIYALVGLLAVGASAAPATEAKASSKSSSTAKVTKANLTPTLKKDSLRCATSNGEPLFPGIYREPYRPQIHHSISHGFSNDPNGLIYVNGVSGDG